MFVIEVIPFLHFNQLGSLSYRSTKDLPVGSLVTITVRRKKVSGLVISSTHVRELKSVLKRAGFVLSTSVESTDGRLSASLLKALENIALYHGTTLSAVLRALVEPHLRSDLEIPFLHENILGTGHEIRRCEELVHERVREYGKQIAQTIASQKATILVVPTLAEIEFWKSALSGYSPLILSGSLPKARRAQVLDKAKTHVGLIITTPTYSFLQNEHLGLYIIERVSAGSYRLITRPYVDIRVALCELAKVYEIPVMYGDFPLPLEYRERREAPLQVSEITKSITVIDTSSERAKTQTEEVTPEPYRAVPEKVRLDIQHEISKGNSVAVLAVRRGYAPVVVCRDCGHSLKDEYGGTLSFTTSGGERRFRSPSGELRLAGDTVCPVCESWNLLPLGAGVERVTEELREAYPDASIVQIDAEHIRTPSAGRKMLQSIEGPGTIVIGTESMVPWLLSVESPRFSLAVVASADSLLALPFWRARERFVRLVYLMASCAERTIVATRKIEDSAISVLTHPQRTDFFSEESSLRKMLGYPPFGTIISLTLSGTRTHVEINSEDIEKKFEGYSLHGLPMRMTGKNEYRKVFVLKLPEGQWPNVTLSQKILELPPASKVVVDAESFW